MHRVSTVVHRTKTKGERNVRKIVKKIFISHPTETIFKSPSQLFRKLFWAIVYLSGSVLTALTCNDVYQTYKNYPVTVSNKNIRNDTITLPDATVCLPLFHANQLVDYISKYEIAPINSMVYIDGLQSFFENVTSWQDMQQVRWPFPVLYTAQIYLSMIYETEMKLGYGESPMKYFIVNEPDRALLAIKTVLKPKLVEWSVSLGELRDTFAEQFLEFNPVNVSFFSNNGTQKMDDIIQDLAFVTRDQICYMLKHEHVSFVQGSKLQIRMNTQNLAWRWCAVENKNHVYRYDWCYSPSDEPVTIDFTGKLRAGSITREFDLTYLIGFLSKFDSGFSILTVNPQMEYVSVPDVTSIPQCSIKSTAEICQRECRNEIIKKFCTCSGITAPSQTLQTIYCMIGQYENCLENITSPTDCISRCLDSCTRWQYDITKKPGVTTSDKLHHEPNFIIEIQVSTFDYQIFEESSYWSFEAIIGVIGGASGFWLGLDIIVIVYQILTAPILFLMDKRYPKISEHNEVESKCSEIKDEEERRFGRNLIAAVENQLGLKSWDIHDLDFVKWVVRKLIWSVLFLIGAAMTIKMFVQLYQQYEEGGFQSNVTLLFNKTMKLPPSAVCVPINYDYSMIYSPSFNLSEVSALINWSDSRETFLGKQPNQTWPSILTLLVTFYLDTIFTLKNGNFDPRRLIFEADELNYLILYLTYNRMVKFSVTHEELQEKFGYEFIKDRNIAVRCASSTENKTYVMTPTKITMEESSATGEDDLETAVCVHFPLDDFVFQSVNDMCSVSMNYQGRDEVYLVVESGYTNGYISPDLQFDSEYRRMNVTFVYSVIYQSIVNCSAEISSPAICMTNCRDSITEQLCQNFTTSNLFDTETKQYTLDEYKNCLNSTVAVWKKKCADDCKLLPCTRAMYITNNVQDKYYTFLGSSYHYSQVMNIQIQNFVYLLMAEQPIWTRESFIASSGGVLGFWLGLDATFFISIILVPIMLIVEACLKRKTIKTPNPELQSHRQFSLLKSFAKLILGLRFEKVSRPFIIKSLFEQCFWKVVYLIFGLLTFQMCSDFYEQYRSSQIMTISSTMRNRSLAIPSTTLCVSWFDSDFKEFESLNNHTDILKQEELYLNVSNLFMTRESILDTSSAWPIALLQIVHQYLAFVEGYKAMEQVDLISLWSAYKNDSKHKTNSAATVDLLGAQLELQNISSNELLQKFGQELLQNYLMNITKYVEINGTLLADHSLQIHQTTFVSNKKVCYALPSEAMSFASVYEYVSIKIDKSSMPLFESDKYNCFLPDFECSYCVNTVDLLGRETGSTGDNMITAQFTKDMTPVLIEIGEKIRMLPVVNEIQRCSDTTVKSDCMGECRTNAIKQQCNCTPSDANTKDEVNNRSISTECSWAQFKNCLPSFSQTNASICMENCMPSCDFIRYVIHSPLSDGSDDRNRCKSEFVIGASSFQYTMFTEKLQWTFYSFASGLGGTVGIWLGLDFVCFIEWIISIANWLFITAKNLSKKKKTIGISNASEVQ